LVNVYDRNPSTSSFCLFGEARKWWMNMDKETRWNLTWEEFETLFSDKWIRDTKIEAMYLVQVELKESK
jgi:hypothetical protein